ncbi:MAG: EamA family transporter [Acidimicrobiales bacterium]
MTAVLALSSALLIGTADFGGGLATRCDSPFRVTLWTQASSGATALVLVWLVPWTHVTGTDIIAGGLAGLSGSFSFVCFYAALSRGAMGAVAPVTAIVGAVVPAVVGFGRGEGLSAPAAVGLVAAVGAIALVTVGPGEGGDRTAFVLAAVAGLGFSIFFVALGETSDTAGLWPLVFARATSIPLVGLTTWLVAGSVALHHSARRPALAAGVMEMAANIVLLWALQRGPLAVVSVFGSLYPISTALLAWMVLGERLGRSQVVGVVVATAALALVAI